MIEATNPTMHEEPVPDPDFRVEAPSGFPLAVPASIAVSVDHTPDIQWGPSELISDYERARSVLEEIIASSKREVDRNPESTRPRVNYGLALLNAGDVDAATEQFERARAIDGDDVSVLSHLARARLMDGRIEEARDLAAQLQRRDPANISSAMLAASIEMVDQNPRAAKRVLIDVIQRDPEAWAPQYMMGILTIASRQPKEAIAYLRSAARGQQRSAAVRHALGVAFGLSGEWKKAVRSFREALELAPRRRESVLALAHAFLRSRDADAAVAALSDWVAIAGQDREAQELLAGSYSILGNHRAAKRHLLIALQSIVEDRDRTRNRARVMNNIGYCAGSLGDHQEAADWFTRSIQTCASPVAFRNLAQAYRRAGDNEAALKVLDAALERFGDDIDARVFASIVAADLGRIDDAISNLYSVVRQNAGRPDAYACLGWVLADERRDYKAALAVLREGYQKFPNDGVIANNLAYVELLLGDVESARAVLGRVPEKEIRASVYLTATLGLLRLYEGDFQEAATLYRAAESLASSYGDRRLAMTVRQKMHLEFARAYVRSDDPRNAESHLRAGMAIKGRRSYHDDMKGLSAGLLVQ